MGPSAEDEARWLPEKYNRGSITPKPERMFRSGPPLYNPQTQMPPAHRPASQPAQTLAALALTPVAAPALGLGLAPPAPSPPPAPADRPGPSPCAKYRKIESRHRPTLPLSDAEAAVPADDAVNNTALGHHKESPFSCLNCGDLPTAPVTGGCGHSRCRACVERHGACPCGEPAPSVLNTDILVKSLIATLYPTEKIVRSVMQVDIEKEKESQEVIPRNATSAPPSPSISACHDRAALKRTKKPFDRVRYRQSKRTPFYMDSINYEQLKRGWESRRPALQRSARRWLLAGELDCVLCCRVLRAPLHVPCGHTFCRDCLQRSVDFRDHCPLCATKLIDFNIDATQPSKFVVGAIEMTGRSAAEPPDTDHRLPLFVCTNAFPMVPCPLYIFEPRYRLMIRRVLRSEAKCFGMVAYDCKTGFGNFGTMLEIRDCVNMPDGRSVLTTIGVSRFRILRREKRDGYHVAYTERLADEPPARSIAVRNLVRRLHLDTRTKAVRWLGRLEPPVRAKIEASFGPLPHSDGERAWINSADGPAWLWWLISILPLDPETKTMTVAERSVYKRMLVVDRTIDALQSPP